MKHAIYLLLLAVACKPESGGDTATSGGSTEAATTEAATTGAATTTASTSIGTTEATPTTSGATEASTTANPTTGTTGGSTTGGGAAACMNYCSEIGMNCSGANAQYAGADSCLGVCAAFPAGTEGDVSGNSLACRLYHTGAAAEDANTHCVHAGPGGAGACGSNCEGFCTIATAICPTEHPDTETCMKTCMGFMDTEKYDAGDAGGDTLACRLYHLTVAATDAAAAMTHCPHTVLDSAPCK